MPLLAGTNSQESGFDAVLGPNPPTLDNYKQALHRIFGDKAERALQLYPAATDEEVMDAATELASDRFLGYSTWQWVETHGKTAKGQPTFYYFYARPRPTPTNPEQTAERGAVHSAEIEYAMGNLDTNKVFAWTPEDHKISETMQAYFANFIKQRDPNGAGLPKWDAYNKSDAHPRLTIDVTTRLERDTRRPRYELAEQLSTR